MIFSDLGVVVVVRIRLSEFQFCLTVVSIVDDCCSLLWSTLIENVNFL